MKQNSTKLAVAVATVLSGLGMVPVAQAVHISPDGLGQYLPGEYYNTNNGMFTEFNISNTSDQVVVVKARFHEAINSRDVFDFNIILSPYDVFPFYVAPGAKGPVLVIPDDYTCTVPNLPVNTTISFENGITSYTGDNADGGPTTYARMNEGYPEFIVMGAGDPDNDIASLAVHENVKGGKPVDCAQLAKYFGTGDPAAANNAQVEANLAALRGAEGFPDYPLAPLAGLWSLVDVAAGVGTAGGRMAAMANFCNDDFDSSRKLLDGTGDAAFPAGNGCAGLMTLQRPPQPLPQVAEPGNVLDYMDSYNEPSAVSANTLGAYIDVNGLQYVDNSGNIGADAVSYALMRAGLWNAWTNRPGDAAAGIWDTNTDFILTFPTKRFYVDADVKIREMEIASARYQGRNPLPVAPGPFTEAFGATTPGQSCDPVSVSVWDREEWKPECTDCGGDDPVISPSPIPPNPETPDICTEVVVFEFGDGVLGSSVGVNINDFLDPFTLADIGINGQANVNIDGLPAVGASVIKRVLNAQTDLVAFPHAWDRPESLKTDGASSTVNADGPYNQD